MLRVIVLGTTAALPNKDSLPACCAVKFGGTYLFDACEAVQQQLMKFGGGGNIEAIFITHLHADHILGVPGLLQSMTLSKRQTPLLIVGPKGTKQFFTAMFSLPGLRPGFPVEFKEVTRSGLVFKNKLFTVKAFGVKHGTPAVGYCMQCVTYRRFDKEKAVEHGVKGGMFTQLQEDGWALNSSGKKVKFENVSYLQEGKKIVFSGDTEPCPSLVRAAKGADLLFHDSTFANDHVKAAKEKHHSTARQAAEVASKAKIKKLVLTHFSNRYDDRSILLAQAQEVFPETVLAQEGMELMV